MLLIIKAINWNDLYLMIFVQGEEKDKLKEMKRETEVEGKRKKKRERENEKSLIYIKLIFTVIYV